VLVASIIAAQVVDGNLRVEGLGGALLFGAIFVALNLLYFSTTERVIFKDRLLDVKFYRSGHFIPYEGVTAIHMTPSGEITVAYRIQLHDGSYTSYSLPAVFEPEEPKQVLEELRRRVEAARSAK